MALIMAPLLPGIINRVKSISAGRVGPPLLQTYFDLYKLVRKGAVYSTTTTFVFRAGPVVCLGALVMAALLLPFGGTPGIISFSGDLLLFIYLFGLLRFFCVLAALDTGSSFEGMGASREMWIASLAEPALLVGLIALVRITHTFSLSGAILSIQIAKGAIPALVLIAAAFFLVFLAENSRIPVDDPNTHLELTMIHEVMVLDHGGPDFALIQYTAALKLWVLGSLIINTILPFGSGHLLASSGIAVLAMFALAVVVGLIESSMGRLRLTRIPQLLIIACAFSVLALMMVVR